MVCGGRQCFGWPKQSDWLSNCCLSFSVVACVVFFWHSLPEQAKTTSERMNGIDGSLELLCPQHSNKSRQKARQKRLPLSLLASRLTLKGSRRCLCSLTGGPSSLSSTVPITSGHRRYRYAVLCDHLCSPLSLHPYEYRAMGDKVRIVCVCVFVLDRVTEQRRCRVELGRQTDAASSEL